MSSRLEVAVANLQEAHPVDKKQLAAAARRVVNDAGFSRGEISIAVVDDSRMHELNRQYLQHDYPTDVLSFVLEQGDDSLEGEIIVSADYAFREAARFGWETQDELLLYVIHGSLHLVGYDDQYPEAKREMRQQERHFLALFGKTPRYDED